MSEKRRDSKNRILRSGESQRKDGRYAYKYIDATGKPQFVYSWKLEATDSTPQGKRDGLSLREKEKQIRRDIEDAIIPRGGEMTVLDLVKSTSHRKPASGTTPRPTITLSSISSRKRTSADSALTG